MATSLGLTSTKQAPGSPRALLGRLSAKPHEARRVGHKPREIHRPKRREEEV